MVSVVSMIALGGPTLKLRLRRRPQRSASSLNDSTGRAYTETKLVELGSACFLSLNDSTGRAYTETILA